MVQTLQRLVVAAGCVTAVMPPPAGAQEVFADGFETGMCAWSAVVPEPVEVCDSLDNDCNSTVDDGCVHCSPPDPAPVCGPSSHCTPQTDGDSLCSQGAGAGTQGQACTAPTDCAPGYACAFTGLATQCLRWCEAPFGSCPLGSNCFSATPAVYTGATEWGLCL